MTPLVSAIMPTRSRREFVPAAVECFLSQDWPNKELIIVDDGDSIEDLVRHPLVRYTRAGGTIGLKRNIACQLARGEYIVHFDDDDWYGPKRISEQVRILRQSSRPATGYHTLPFAWDDGRRAWLYLGRNGYACGTSLCYLRAYWAGHRFEHVQIGEDNRFIRGLGDRFISQSQCSIVARVHGAATCPKIELLTGTKWTGATGQVWKEIDYARLAEIGYPARAEGIQPDLQELPVSGEQAFRPEGSGERPVASRGKRKGRSAGSVSGTRRKRHSTI